MIKILITDDHPIFRAGLAAILEQYSDFKVVGQASNGDEAITKAIQLEPDVIIMDISMHGITGVEATQILQEKCPEAKVLIITVSARDEDLFAAIKAGAKGYLLKNIALEELIESVRLVASGEAIISPPMAIKLLEEFKQTSRTVIDEEVTQLSLREREVLELVAQGASNKEIATRFFISDTTVKAHLRNILDKLHVKNRAQAVAVATAKGLLNKNTKPQ